MLVQPTVSIPIPMHLLIENRKQPFRIGLYALIARLYLHYQRSVALPRNTIHEFDSSVSVGSIIHNTKQLTSQGWIQRSVAATSTPAIYHPCWKITDTSIQPWVMKRNRVSIPHGLDVVTISSRVIDDGIGFITLFDNSFYVYHVRPQPRLTVRDIGEYLLHIVGVYPSTAPVRALDFID